MQSLVYDQWWSMFALGLLIDPDCILCKDHDFPLEPVSRHVALDFSVTDLLCICIHVCICRRMYKKTTYWSKFHAVHPVAYVPSFPPLVEGIASRDCPPR